MWKIDYTPLASNQIASEIAIGVTRDHGYQSYIARNGPSWVQDRIITEARSENDQALPSPPLF